MGRARDERRMPRSMAKRKAILAAATEMFLELGFGAASMDLIAKRAGVSKATVYKHFRGKEALFGAIIEARCRQLMAPLLTPEMRPNGLEATLLATANGFMDLLMDPAALALYRVVVAEAPRFPELARAFYENGPKRAIGSLADYLSREAAAGYFDIADPVRAAEQFFSLTSGYVHMRALLGIDVPRRGADVQEHVRRAVDTFLRAYGARTRRTAPPL